MGSEAPGKTDRDTPPDALRLVRDFVNTLDTEEGPDSSQRPRGLSAWLTVRGLVDPRTDLTATNLARARELREALRALLLANAGGPLNPAAVETLNRIGHAAPLQAHFDQDGIARFEPAASGVDAAIGRLLAIVVAAIGQGSWVRLKVCRSGDCRWAFYDVSKNRSAAWCSMAVCGNRNKVRAYQQRQRVLRSE